MPPFGGATSATGSTGALSFTSPTVSGSNTYGIVIVEVIASDTVTTVTWNGAAMTLLIKQDATSVGNVWFYIYGIVAPAAGATTVVCNRSPSGTILASALYYTGAQQTITPDSTNSTLQLTSSSTFTQSTTTVANNAWIVALVQDGSSGSVNGSVTQGNSRVNSVGNYTIIDNGPKTPAGSVGVTGVWGDNVAKSGIAVSIAPVVLPDPQFDNATDFTLGMVTQSTWTFNHTVGTNANRVLFVGVSTFNSTTVGVTYNGVSMTSVVAVAGIPLGESSMWVLANPPSGSNAVVVTTSAADNGIVIGAMSFYNANPTSPIDGTASNSASSSATASTTLTTSHSNTVALDWLLVWENPTNGTATVGTGQTELLNATVNCQPAGRWIIGASSSWQTPSPTMQWTGLATGTSRGWAQCVLGVRAFAPAVGGGSFLFNLM